mgnify:CR=1 FL=1
MKINVEVYGLNELRALLEANRRLTDELLENTYKIEYACMTIREKENQPESGTNG